MNIPQFLCCLALLLGCSAPTLAFLEQEISFSEADIQNELAKRGPLEKRYGDLLIASGMNLLRAGGATVATFAAISAASAMLAGAIGWRLSRLTGERLARSMRQAAR